MGKIIVTLGNLPF